MGVQEGNANSSPELTVTDVLRLALEKFPTNPIGAKAAIRRIAHSNPRGFALAALNLLLTERQALVQRRLVGILLETGGLLEAVADRNRLNLDEAVELVRSALLIEPLLDAKLLQCLLERVTQADGEAATALVREVLAVYDAAGLGGRLIPQLIQLLRTSDKVVRSKVARLFRRGTGQVAWAIQDPDPRVRANGVEALGGLDSRAVRDTLWRLARDPHQRVVANALVALMRLGAPGAAAELQRMARRPEAAFRASAAWAMGESGNPEFLPLLDEMTQDPDESVRRNALKSAARLPRPQPPRQDLPEEHPLRRAPGVPAAHQQTPPAQPPTPLARAPESPVPPQDSYEVIRGLSLNDEPR
jgi:HEAT repeat protein